MLYAESEIPPGWVKGARRFTGRGGFKYEAAPPEGQAKVDAAMARLAATDLWVIRVMEIRSIMPDDRVVYRDTLRKIIADPSIPWPTEPAPWDERRLVSKNTIIKRAEAREYYVIAKALMKAPEAEEAKDRWNERPGWDNVYFDDPLMLTMLDAVLSIALPEASDADRLVEREWLVATLDAVDPREEVPAP